jgi:hypothetical protein
MTRSANPVFTPPPGHAGPRRSLVLSGGGMRLSYQAGVLRALEQAGLHFHHVDATSGGAINLAMLLSGLSPAEMCERWASLDLRKSLALLPLDSYLEREERVALGSADGFVRHVFPHLGINLARVREAAGVQGTFNVFDYGRKVNEVVPHQEMDMDFLVAGMSLPGVMPPVAKNGTLYLDSAFVRDANLMEAVRRGAEEVWLVWCLGNTDEYRGGPLRLYIQMLEMAANGSLIREFEEIEALNRRILAGDSPHGQTRPIRLHPILPAHPLPLDPELYLGRVTAAALIRMGFADAQRYLDGRTDAGRPLTPETIQMTSAAPGITFHETMKGGFALGETDPKQGAKAGARTPLAIHVTITIRDLDRFLSDPGRAGTLVGHVDFAPLGTGVPTGEGVFRLFSPGGDARTKLMVYELPFEHAGQRYYLAGRKEVRNDPGFDLWSDTTTLFTRLHQGDDASGPVVGAGILSIGAVDFAKVLRSIRAIDTGSAAESARLIARFGQYFAGELWKSYVLPTPR